MKFKNTVISFIYIAPALVVTIFVRLLSDPIIGDDAYMTFRVVRNLLEGNGFVCNPGEHVISTTTPFFALMLAFVSYILDMSPDLAYPYFCYTLDVCNIILLFSLTYLVTSNNVASGISSLFFSLSSFNIYASLLGMETPLFVFLLLFSTLMFLREENIGKITRYDSIGFIAAVLLCMTRPEGVLFAFLYFIFRWCNLKHFPNHLFLISSAILIPWVIGLYWYFGTITPQSIEAKRLGYIRANGEALFGIMQGYVRLFFTATQLLNYFTYVALFLFISLVIIWGSIISINKNRNLLILPLFLIGFIVVYAVANPFIFFWYLVPLEPFYCILFAIGICNLIARFESFNKIVSWFLTSSLVLLLVLAFYRYENLSVSIVDEWPVETDNSVLSAKESLFANIMSNFKVPFFGVKQREQLYKEAAFFLEPFVTNKTTVMGPEFGAFGYFSKAKVISSIGHVNPYIMKYLPLRKNEVAPQINTAIPLRMVKGELPDYILSLDIFYQRSLMNDSWFNSNYKVIFSKESKAFNSRTLNIFARNDLLQKHGL